MRAPHLAVIPRRWQCEVPQHCNVTGIHNTTLQQAEIVPFHKDIPISFRQRMAMTFCHLGLWGQLLVLIVPDTGDRTDDRNRNLDKRRHFVVYSWWPQIAGEKGLNKENCSLHYQNWMVYMRRLVEYAKIVLNNILCIVLEYQMRRSTTTQEFILSTALCLVFNNWFSEAEWNTTSQKSAISSNNSSYYLLTNKHRQAPPHCARFRSSISSIAL